MIVTKLPGIFKKEEISAKVIWAKTERDIDVYVLFRKKFNTEDEIAEIKIFGDTYYNLYIDGSFIHRGPVRRHESHAEYDKLEIALDKGEHTIAVLVHHLGKECAGHRKGDKAFWCEIDTKAEKIITDESWKAKFLDAFITDGRIFSHFDFCEDVNKDKFPDEYLNGSFDDSAWENAEVLCGAGTSEDIHKDYSLRLLKLFSYINENGKLIKSGTYLDTIEPDSHFTHKLNSRKTDVENKNGNYFLYEFEASISGTVQISYECSEDSEIVIGYDDQLTENGFIIPNRWIRHGDRICVKKGKGEAKVFFPRGFRYVLAQITGEGKILGVKAEKEVYPYVARKSFESNSAYLNKLFDQSVKTQQVCTIDGFTDCVNRERVLWLGDAYFDCLGSYYSTFDKGLLLTTLYEHAMGQSESGALGGYNSSNMKPDWLLMPSYNLMYLEMVIDYLLYTGDEESILPLKETVKKILSYILTNINEKGVFDTAFKGCSSYWDWGYSEPDGENVKFGAYFAFIVDRMKAFDFFSDVLTDEIINAAEKIKEVSHGIFFDNNKKVYKDSSSSDLTTQAATSYAVLGGIKGSENYKELFYNITDPENLDAVPVGENQSQENSSPDLTKILPAATMYGATVTARAMLIKGMYNEALDYINTVWGDFKDLPTLPELRRNGRNNTMCHGWSASPAYLLPMFILGVRPIKEGYKEAVFHIPEIDAKLIDSVSGSVITPFGNIEAAWTNHNGFVKADVSVPLGVKLTVKYKEKEYLLKNGANTVYFKA